MPISRLASSFGNSVCHELSHDRVQAFFARYKLVVCMNLFVLFFLCICSGFFNGSSSSRTSSTGGLGSKGLDGLSKSYPSYMDYKAGASTRSSSSASPAAAGGRLRGLPRNDKGDTSPKASFSPSSLSSSASWASSTHVPQRPPPRFVPGTLRQSEDKPVAATNGAASHAAGTASKTTKPAMASKPGTSSGSSKKNALLDTLVSSTKPTADMLVTSAAEAVGETAMPAMTKLDALMEPVDADAGMVPISTEEDTVSVQCAFSEEAEGEELTPILHHDLIRDAEEMSEENVRAPPGQAEGEKEKKDDEEEGVADPMAAPEAVTNVHADPSVSALCPLTPPSSSKIQGEPIVEVAEVGVSPNPDVVDAEENEALEVQAADMGRVDEPIQQLEEQKVAMPLPQVRHHPLEYIPPFAREDVFC